MPRRTAQERTGSPLPPVPGSLQAPPSPADATPPRTARSPRPAGIGGSSPQASPRRRDAPPDGPGRGEAPAPPPPEEIRGRPEPRTCDNRPMTTLKSKLQDDLNAAIKERDELRSSTLRLTLAAITKEEVAGTTKRELSDDEVQKVITREAKKRREAAEAFAGAGRAEQAEREKAEGEVLAGYLPKQLSDEELTAIVAQAVEEAKAAGAEGPRAMGAVMKIVNPKVAGQAEGGRVAAAVKKLLAAG
ncbi:hypothetical protein GCM10010238_51970 [Streptomyces griseoviridis]|uniref:Glutamyl-tRNA amidotransferase n=3 Tax=Streptomyces TaxID=1883 RepID=A0A918GT12_STRGD|nr:hypothetical protein GCM10010238_51970 [Streptomyces niveoruber]